MKIITFDKSFYYEDYYYIEINDMRSNMSNFENIHNYKNISDALKMKLLEWSINNMGFYTIFFELYHLKIL